MIRSVGVVVPVHDEEDSLGDCLQALDLAARHAAELAAVHVVVVLDACRDESLQIAADFAVNSVFETLVIDERNVGRARAAGVARVLSRFESIDPSQIWIATSDADSTVPKTWLADHLAVAHSGAQALTGVVRVRRSHPFPLPHLAAFEQFYDAFGGVEHHGHVHGANLGVRADAYLQVGGFPDLRTGEDQALVRALREAGHDVVATRAIEVVTSGRLEGRAPAGFAEFLAQFADRIASAT